MPRITRIWLVLLLGLWLPTGCAKPPAEPLNPPQKALAACLDLASEVAKHAPDHARGRAARDRYLAMCLDSR